MDVLGRRRDLARPAQPARPRLHGAPICITVEGANILTRTLMVFGQGAIRCHPFARREIDALAAGTTRRAFDRAFWAHVGHVIRNGVRAPCSRSAAAGSRARR
jgi:acyl-CoA dehydrogenase